MNTNLHQQYVSHQSHDIIRRRMRWFIMLVMILGASLFVTYFNSDEPTAKGFMNSSIVNPVLTTQELSTADGGNGLRSVTNRQLPVAVILWDEQRKGSDPGCSRELISKAGFVICGTEIEESLPKPNTA